MILLFKKKIFMLFHAFFFAKKRYPGVNISFYPPSTKSKAVAFNIALIAIVPFGAILKNSKTFTKK